MQFDDIQSVIEILTEFSLLNHLGKALIGRGYHAQVNFNALVTSQAFKFPLLEHPQEFRLQSEREIADFVQEKSRLSQLGFQSVKEKRPSI